jgi:hypothetical protein
MIGNSALILVQIRLIRMNMSVTSVKIIVEIVVSPQVIVQTVLALRFYIIFR